MNSDYSMNSEMEKNMEIKSPFFKVAKKVITSNAAKAAGKAVANQLVESGANIATDALMGNDVNESFQRELQAGRHNAAIGVQKLKRGIQQKRTKEPTKKKKKTSIQSKYNTYMRK